MAPTLMTLEVLLPDRVFAKVTGVSRIVAESQSGHFGLLPHRLDCVAPLISGILIYQIGTEPEVLLAVDLGVLVKIGLDVRVSVRRAIRGTDLARLRHDVKQTFLALDAHEQAARQAAGKLEASLLQRLAATTRG